ncbi:protein kinase domain-containing protein [Dokdonella sp. MW10]|uniref:serine/threonine-protein kinase n=1 Tax=Dokdonella sp. MW10 TaxID=2992926 RepID=UPI003F7CE212
MTTLTFEPGGALRSRLVSTMLAEHMPALAAGTLVGPFRVVRLIGQGGLGVVYLAERADGAFEQQVALKLIAPEADPGVAGVLLERERRLLARLRHPNIARLLDGGRNDDGTLWFAMDHVEGQRIDRWCESRGLDARARIALVLEVCAAVGYAHARLVVHRDIKPSNILVDADGVPRLLDFGIAAALDDASDDPARRAATPGYASPEQHRGDPAGVAQDVYQLGRLLAALLGDGVARRDRGDVAAILARATDDDPARRYPGVDALAADLRALLANRPVAASNGAWAYRVARVVRRHRIATLASVATSLLLVAMAVAFVWNLDQERQRAEREAETARRVSSFMVGLFKSADPALHHGRVPAANEVLALAPPQIERELATEPRIMMELLGTIGTAFVSMRDYEGARAPLRRAIELSRGLDVAPEVRANLLRILAITLDGEQEQARELLGEAVAMLDPSRPAHASLWNITQQNLAMSEYASGHVDAAIRRLRDTLAQGERTLPEGGGWRIADLLGLGSILAAEGEDGEALAMFTEAHAIAREHIGDLHPYTILATGNLATALARAGDHDKAARLADEAQRASLQLYGETSPNHALALLQKARVLHADGRAQDAVPLLRQAQAICERLRALGNDTLGVDVFEQLGDVLADEGDDDGALAAYRAMIELNADDAHAQGPDRGQRTLKLAQVLARSGRCAEASASQADAIARSTRFPPDARLRATLEAALPACPG